MGMLLMLWLIETPAVAPARCKDRRGSGKFPGHEKSAAIAALFLWGRALPPARR